MGFSKAFYLRHVNQIASIVTAVVRKDLTVCTADFCWLVILNPAPLYFQGGTKAGLQLFVWKILQ